MDIEIIGAGIGCGAQDQRTAVAAQFLNDQGLTTLLNKKGLRTRFESVVSAANTHRLIQAMAEVASFSESLAAKVRASIQAHRFPVVVGGDHSCAIGTWSGVASAIPGDLGLIWIDAHMDSHTPETTETGAIHGMPLASLLGYGDSRLTGVLSSKPKLKPENLALIGVRSFEQGEEALLDQLGVRVFKMTEVRARGFQNCFDQALSIASGNGRSFGVSLDLDGFDPKEVAATGVLCPDGLFVKEVKEALAGLRGHAQLVGLEIVEYNPALDVDGRTFECIVSLIYETLRATATDSVSSNARPSGSRTTAVFPSGKS